MRPYLVQVGRDVIWYCASAVNNKVWWPRCLEQHLFPSGLRVPVLPAWSDSSEALLALLQEEKGRGRCCTLSMRALTSQTGTSSAQMPHLQIPASWRGVSQQRTPLETLTLNACSGG